MITKQILLQSVSQHFLVRQSSISILSQRTVGLVNLQEGRAGEGVNAYYCKTVSQIDLINWVNKQLPHLIYLALATNYLNVFMSTTVLLGLTSFEKIGGQWIFGGASDFSNLLAPWASGSRSLMLRDASRPDTWRRGNKLVNLYLILISVV